MSADKLQRLVPMVRQDDPDHEEYAFWCPGCRCTHSFVVKTGPKVRAYREAHKIGGCPEWSFNQNMGLPTFNPSLLYSETNIDDQETHRCHLFMVDGMIQYLGDCSHDLKGQQIPLQEFPVRV